MENKNQILLDIKTALQNLRETKGELSFNKISKFYDFLRDLLKDPEFQAEYEQLKGYLEELSIYRFRSYEPSRFYDFFISGIENLLRQGIDASFFVESIKEFNYQFWNIEDYKISRERTLNDLYKNKGLLTKTNILYENGREEEGSIKNWFKHYQTYFDHSKELRLSLMEYLDKNKSVMRLTAEEKMVLRNFIYVIEYLRAPAEEVLRDEESALVDMGNGVSIYFDGGETFVFDDNEMKGWIEFDPGLKKTAATTPPAGPTSEAPATELAAVTPTRDWRQLIQLSENDLMQLKFVSQKYKLLNNEEVLNYFWEGVDSYNEEMVLGAIQELISRQQWDWFFGQTRLKLLLKDFSSRRPNHVPTEDPRFWLQVFFEWILEEHLGMTEERTKKWALYFNNLLLKYDYQQYKGLLSFDKNSQKLQWFQK
ncbi:MAG TPA: hypothetical protein PL066_03425 [bacterium]|nr:hypothetical protein [bacterium]